MKILTCCLPEAFLQTLLSCWRQEKATGLFEELKDSYDYVIVDTAPAMLVSDTFLINKYADLTLYLVRAGYTEKKLLNFALEPKNEANCMTLAMCLTMWRPRNSATATSTVTTMPMARKATLLEKAKEQGGVLVGSRYIFDRQFECPDIDRGVSRIGQKLLELTKVRLTKLELRSIYALCHSDRALASGEGNATRNLF